MKTTTNTEKTIQITAGRGPAECCWVVAQVLKLFMEEARKKEMEVTMVHREKGSENRTLQSVTLNIRGKGLELFLVDWLGTIHWIGTSEFRIHHKRKNWFIGIFELELMQTDNINEKDILYQSIRSSGPGGQHVNKVNSAVRAIHVPTNTQTLASDSRSQHQNKKLARTRLKEKIKELNLEVVKRMATRAWGNHLNLQRGNPVRVFRGTDFKKLKVKREYKTKRIELKNDLRKQQWD